MKNLEKLIEDFDTWWVIPSMTTRTAMIEGAFGDHIQTFKISPASYAKDASRRLATREAYIHAYQKGCRDALRDIDGILRLPQNEVAMKYCDLKDKMRKYENVLFMVLNNSRMPHYHKDPLERLYCLAERAREVIEE